MYGCTEEVLTVIHMYVYSALLSITDLMHTINYMSYVATYVCEQ